MFVFKSMYVCLRMYLFELNTNKKKTIPTQSKKRGPIIYILTPHNLIYV